MDADVNLEHMDEGYDKTIKLLGLVREEKKGPKHPSKGGGKTKQTYNKWIYAKHRRSIKRTSGN